MKKNLLSLTLLLVVATLSSCGEYQKVLKSQDLSYKYDMAVKYYEAKQYNKAYPLFDELLTLNRGTARAQEVYYFYCMTLYGQKDYILAQYHFKTFSKTFPRHPKAEEAAYMSAFCLYLDAPSSSLDPAAIYKAIDELQLFINTNASSPYMAQCNAYIDELRERLEKKSFEIAKQYYKTQRYASAVVAFSNTLAEFPDTRFREEAMFYKLDAAFQLAQNSVSDKQLLRYKEALTVYRDLMSLFPESVFSKDAERIKAKIDAYLQNPS